MEAKVSAVLKLKGDRVVTVTPQQTVASVVEVLVQNRIGAASVGNEDGQLVGIISERDIIRGISEHADTLLTLPAERLMTREVRTCTSEDRLVDIIQVSRFRGRSPYECRASRFKSLETGDSTLDQQ